MNKLDKIKNKPVKVNIMDEEYTIFPLTFEDQLDVSGVKKNGTSLDMSDDKTKEMVKDLVKRKMKESLKSEGIDASDDDLKHISPKFIGEYMTALFKISNEEGGSKKV